MNIYVATLEPISNDYMIVTNNGVEGTLGGLYLPEMPCEAGSEDKLKKGSLFKVKITSENDPDSYIICKKEVKIKAKNYSGNHYYTFVDDNDNDLPIFILDGGSPVLNDQDDVWTPAVPNGLSPIYNDNPVRFVTQGVCNDYITLVWPDNFYEPGAFSMDVVDTPENRTLFETGRYLLCEKSEHVMIIEKVVTNAALTNGDQTINITGRSLESILDRRTAFPGVGLNTSDFKSYGGLVKGLKHLVDGYFVHPELVMGKDNKTGNTTFYYPERCIPFMTISEDDTTDFPRGIPHATVNRTVSKTDILSVIVELCKNERIGFKIIPKQYYDSMSTILEVHFYQGHDYSYTRPNKDDKLLIFSPMFGNVDSISTTKDDSKFKNVVFCAKERDADAYVDLSVAPSIFSSGISASDTLESIELISNIKSKMKTKFSDNNISRTCVYFIAVAASRTDLGYTNTVTNIEGLTKSKDGQYPYPSKYFNGTLKITYKKVIGGSSTETGTFTIGDNSDDINWLDKFKESTAYGWLNSDMLKEAKSAISNSNINKLLKIPLNTWFSTIDAYTSSYATVKWLCSTYETGAHAANTGLNRREVFVEEETEEDDDWTTADRIAFMHSTELISTNNEDDEEDDDKILERLTNSARKKSGEYRQVHETDVKCNGYNAIYMQDYNLGDLVQIDDGKGGIERYIITGVTIADDTSRGEQIIPSFTKYERIPDNYVELDDLTVSQMILPATFNKVSSYTNDMVDANLDGDLKILSQVNPYVYKCTSILNEVRFNWTEIEAEFKRQKNSVNSTLQDQVSIISQKAFNDESETEHVYKMPRNIVTGKKHPMNIAFYYWNDPSTRIEWQPRYDDEEELDSLPSKIYDLSNVERIYPPDSGQINVSMGPALKFWDGNYPKTIDDYNNPLDNNYEISSDFYQGSENVDDYNLLHINMPSKKESGDVIYAKTSETKLNEDTLSEIPLQESPRFENSDDKEDTNIYIKVDDQDDPYVAFLPETGQFLGEIKDNIYDRPYINFYKINGYTKNIVNNHKIYTKITDAENKNRMFFDLVTVENITGSGREEKYKAYIYYPKQNSGYAIAYNYFFININNIEDPGEDNYNVFIPISAAEYSGSSPYTYEVTLRKIYLYNSIMPNGTLQNEYDIGHNEEDPFTKQILEKLDDFTNSVFSKLLDPLAIKNFEDTEYELNYIRQYEDDSGEIHLNKITDDIVFKSDFLGKKTVDQNQNELAYIFNSSGNIGKNGDTCNDGYISYIVNSYNQDSDKTDLRYLYYSSYNSGDFIPCESTIGPLCDKSGDKFINLNSDAKDSGSRNEVYLEIFEAKNDGSERGTLGRQKISETGEYKYTITVGSNTRYLNIRHRRLDSGTPIIDIAWIKNIKPENGIPSGEYTIRFNILQCDMHSPGGFVLGDVSLMRSDNPNVTAVASPLTIMDGLSLISRISNWSEQDTTSVIITPDVPIVYKSLYIKSDYGKYPDYFYHNDYYYHITNEAIKYDNKDVYVIAKPLYLKTGSSYHDYCTKDTLKQKMIDSIEPYPSISEDAFTGSNHYVPSDNWKMEVTSKSHGLYNYGIPLPLDAGLYNDNVIIAGLYCGLLTSTALGEKVLENRWLSDWADVDNGVTFKSIKIYEYNAVQRGYDFLDINKKEDENENIISEPLFVQQIVDTDSKRLTHEYVPVKYIGSEKDEFSKLTDEEQYGFYDTVDEVFVPINNFDNKSAKFISSGGEVKKR